MRDPIKTRESILDASGRLFNTKGYKATSISDITTATGFTKGAVYRHFENKEDLEMESLTFLSTQMFEKMRAVIKEYESAGDKLRGIVHFFKSYISNPPIEGGCPLLNVAIEADDANPALRKSANEILNILHGSLYRILFNGQKHGQIRENIDLDYYATLFIAALEGGIMMSKLRGTDEHMLHVTTHLEFVIKELESVN